ncbi:MAG: bifunctional oligoribonuclease/PAP phosphatase NrnA [Solobacterium sp.]|jgi:acetate kinase/phosphoesterase RecJ-like protein|nr:bifunctional oligoribonuclease/PAP phosphatase NrnA [Solobacterium sp.]MCH4205015.1 bifunctional oligoribonuclease/PAP phosphatase NrnA [Solobacterium sp.]MCH4226524.1 bifunctional oligoribonuclease/PAP phosphatase NrnA [Solobacterium sp.]MCH4281808.1 bifunctional oligoribonuclease/PAP phosphatase NrnA [Solobacterium sp.]
MNCDALSISIEQFDTITVFRHEHPDCDALGSQWGLCTWLKDNFPNKKIYALGSETTDQTAFPKSDEIRDDVIKSSLAIVLDTGNAERIDDKRSPLARKVIKIDHHPNIEPFGDVILVDTKAAAVCEILGEYFQSRKDCHLSLRAAEYLYEGLLTDTLCYATSNTTPHTLAIGSYIASQGINIAEINRRLFDQDQKAFRTASYIRSHIQTVHGRVAYCILSCEDLKQLDISGSSARNFINEMGHVKEFAAWCMFTQHDDQGDLYDGSLRSKTICLNDLAGQYHGGGHPNASGVKDLDEKMINTLLTSIYSRV